jgi:hypothetical protein
MLIWDASSITIQLLASQSRAISVVPQAVYKGPYIRFHFELLAPKVLVSMVLVKGCSR